MEGVQGKTDVSCIVIFSKTGLHTLSCCYIRYSTNLINKEENKDMCLFCGCNSCRCNSCRCCNRWCNICNNWNCNCGNNSGVGGGTSNGCGCNNGNTCVCRWVCNCNNNGPVPSPYGGQIYTAQQVSDSDYANDYNSQFSTASMPCGGCK